MDRLKMLENEYQNKLCDFEKLQDEITRETQELQMLKDRHLEAKMQRVAMQEICQTTFENLIRRMGYVESIHGYPDMANKCPNCKEEIEE